MSAKTYSKYPAPPIDDQASRYIFSKVPPQNVPLEELVLGACLIDKDIFPTVVSLAVSEDTFYLDKHKIIFKAMNRLFANQTPIDLVLVYTELKAMGMLDEDGAYYLTELTNKIASTANTTAHCLKLKEAEIRRKVINESFTLINLAYDDTVDALELGDEMQRVASEIAGVTSLAKEKDGDDLFQEAEAFFHKARSGKKGNDPILTGLTELDDILGRMQPGDFGLFAARPGGGKSAAEISIAHHISKVLNVPVGIVSLEMPNLQQFLRLCSQISNISISKIRNADKLSEKAAGKFFDAAKVAKNLPIVYFDGKGELSLVCSKIRTMAARGCKVVFIDYIQLMSAKGYGTRDLELGAISRTLKELAKELNITIIGLCQVKRGNTRPELHELRESGNLEQDADWVVLMYRPEAHGITKDDDGPLPKGYTELRVGKNRNGPIGTALAYFVGWKTKFENNQGDAAINESDFDDEKLF
jgi:replicative DNA helicase